MSRLSNRRTVAIVPAYNEEASIADVVRDLLSEGFPIIVVDDGSNDCTAQVAQSAGSEVLVSEVNRGVGWATVAGLSEAANRGYTYVVTVDGDRQHLAGDAGQVRTHLQQGADLIIGQRGFDSPSVPETKRISNSIAAVLAGPLLRPNILEDVTCGLRGYNLKAIPTWRFNGSKGYGWLLESLASTARYSLSIGTVSVHTAYDDEGERGTPISELTDFLQSLRGLFRESSLPTGALEALMWVAAAQEEFTVRFKHIRTGAAVIVKGSPSAGFYRFSYASGFDTQGRLIEIPYQGTASW